ncbi:hypothetical protein, partial [endosymbiont of Ridgeia piscesae]
QVNGFVPNDNRLHYIFPFLITLFFYRSHGKQYTLPILSERLIAFANVYNNRSPSEGTLLKIGTKIEIIGKPPWTEKIKKIVDSIFSSSG